MDTDEAPLCALEAQMWQLLNRRRRESKLRTLLASPHGSVDLSSNDYLSLSTSPVLKELFLRELRGLSKLGSTGSRLLDGNSSYAENLEHEIASFHHGSAALLANSGFDANVAVFSCLPQPGDVVVYDQLIHASVHDGIKASRVSKAIAFAHNSLTDLKRVLEQCVSSPPAGPSRNVFIAVESVYSMDGDLAPLQGIVEVVEALFPRNNAYIVVDEAHATGIYGNDGRGRVCQLKLESKVFIRLHTFGKALACNGAAIICTPLTRHYLVNYARPLIYTTFMSFPALAMIKAIYTLMAQGHAATLAEKLTALIETLYLNLRSLQIQNPSADQTDSLIQVPQECPESPIIPLYTAEPRRLADFCRTAGYIVRGITAPTVPHGSQRLRICLHAGNTVAEIDGFIHVLRQWIEQEKSKEGEALQTPAARL